MPKQIIKKIGKNYADYINDTKLEIYKPYKKNIKKTKTGIVYEKPVLKMNFNNRLKTY